jgi:glycosyltransferase involved in cell wall biosynthesis
VNVLIVNSLYPPHVIGGAEKSVALLATALVKADHQVTVLTLTPDTSFATERAEGVTVERLPIRNRYWPFEKERDHGAFEKLLWHVRDGWNTGYNKVFDALLDRYQPDVIHTNNLTGLSTELWAFAKQRGIRVVHTLRDYSLLCSRAALFRKGRDCTERCTDCALLTARKKRLSHSVDAVASNSRYVIDRHRQYGYFRDVPEQVIFNIADFAAKASCRSVTSDDDLVFGYIGRVEPEKGIEIVLEATRHLPKFGWRLKIAGDGRDEYVAALKARFDNPQIDWLGFIGSAEFYDSIDTTLIASVWPEPLPRTLIESYAHGRSVICSDAGGIPEIAPLATTGLSYPRYDALALAGAMREAIANKHIWQQGDRPERAALKEFDESTIVARYLALYRGD